MKIVTVLLLAAVIVVMVITTTLVTACATTKENAKPESFLETVEVQAGTFMFGRHGDAEGGTLTEVKESFHIGKYPVTQGQWKAVMGENPSGFDGENAYSYGSYDYKPATVKFNRENLPVETVSWYDVLVFANRLSVREGLKPAYRIEGETDPAKWGEVPMSSNKEWDAVTIVEGANGWRLPAERQWEFTAKGGTKAAGYKGDESDTYFLFSGSDTAGEVAWYGENGDLRTHEVGNKKANELGLYDMSGNVWEWCFDTWDYSDNFRVLRGGSWEDWTENVRLAYRSYLVPHLRYGYIGFRLMRP